MTPREALLGLMGLLALYAVLMAIDLGAGAFYAWGVWRRNRELVEVTEAYASPVWEAAHTLLVFFVLCVEAFFPRGINTFAPILLLPLGLSFALLSVRQLAFALRHEGRPRSPLATLVLLGVVGPLVPLPAMSFFTVLQGQGFRLVGGHPVSSLWILLGHRLTLAFMLAALSGEFFLAASFLHWFSHTMAATRAAHLTRRVALWSGVVLAAAAAWAWWQVAAAAPAGALLRYRVWPWFAGGLGSLGLSLLLLRRDARPLAALLAATATIFLGFGGYALAQGPYLIYGVLLASQAFAHPAMVRALGPVFLVGTLTVILPAAVLLTSYMVRHARARARLASHPG